MFVLLVILFKIKLHARINIFNVIKKKYGQETLKITRNLEELITKHLKIKLHIDFIIKCKREGSNVCVRKISNKTWHRTF